jgi:hypothetical protein
LSLSPARTESPLPSLDRAWCPIRSTSADILAHFLLLTRNWNKKCNYCAPPVKSSRSAGSK